MAKTKTATIVQTKHKGKDVFVLDLGKTRVEKRYRSTRNAAFGAVRANKDWLKADHFDRVIVIHYPDGSKRTGAYWSDGKPHLNQLVKSTKKK